MAKSWAMIDTRTPHPTTNPGERAYLAYWHAWPAPLALPWHKLTQHERNAWMHVARTLTQGQAPHPTTNPGERAYLAYWHAWPAPLALPWHKLTQHERNAWMHVARTLTQGQAPRQRWPPPARETPP